MAPRRKVGMSIAAQVWLMVLLTILIVGGLIAVNTRTEFANQKERVRDALVQRGTATAELLVPTLEPGGDTEQTLGPLAGNPAVKALGSGCNTALATLQQAIDLGYLEIIDASGTVRCTGLEAHLTQQADFAHLPTLLRAVADRTGGTDGAVKDPRTGVLSLFTTVPLQTAEPLSLVYVFPTQDALIPDDTDTKIASLVVDTRDGTVLMRYPDVDGAVGRSIRDTPLDQVATRLNATTTAEGLDGVRRIYRTLRLGDTPYRLIVGQSQAAAYADAYEVLWRDLAFGGVLIVVVGGLGLLLQRRVAKPARRLRQALEHMDDDEGPLAPTHGPSELAQVARAFNRVTTARRRADGLSRAILQHTSDYVLVLNGSGRLTFMGPTAREVLGLPEDATYAHLLALVHPADRERSVQAFTDWRDHPNDDLVLEIRAHDKAGQLRHLEIRAQNLLDDPSVLGVVLTGRDVTERKRFEQHLAHQARHDPLTGLPNRAAVVERLAGLLGDSKDPVAVLFIDLDRFKLVNDSHGHPVGDKVLVTIAQRLVSTMRPGDLVGRFGGDEFVVVAASVGTDTAALELAGRLHSTLEEPLTVEQRDLFVSASIGICLTRPSDTPDGVMRDVDTAVYRAKAAGRNCSALFDDAMREDAQLLLRTQSDLHGAIPRQELKVLLQPVFSLDDGALLGAEALVRWHHPERGLVGPGDFIPVAEETGLIVPIGEWVLREACSWAAREGLRVGRPVRVSVNVSPRQLAHPGFVDTVQEVLTTTGLAPRLLCLEVTEGVLVHDADTASVMLGALHDMGVRISIDDFGTGWSSLTYLQQFPVDDIKLDRSYVSRMTADSTAAAIVASLIGLAGAMGLTVTAEGVETQEQLSFLRAHGCDNGQGYLFSRPVPAAELAPIVTSGQSWLPVG